MSLAYSELSNPQTYIPGAIAVFTVLAALVMDQVAMEPSVTRVAIAKPSVTRVATTEPAPPLDSMILCMISEKDMTAREILRTVKNDYPEVTKSDVNSCLYRMLSKNKVSKDDSAAPNWSA